MLCIVLRSATRSRTCEADFCVVLSVGMRVGVGSETGGGGRLTDGVDEDALRVFQGLLDKVVDLERDAVLGVQHARVLTPTKAASAEGREWCRRGSVSDRG